MPTSDERSDDEDPQPGDLVIELHNGYPVVYTAPETGGKSEGRKANARNIPKKIRIGNRT